MTHSVLAIANEFLARAEQSNSSLTSMHLQKLCYFAHGFCLATTNKPLTNDTIEAWEFGPVFPVLYDAVKRYGSGRVVSLIHENNWAVTPLVRGSIVRDLFKPDEKEIIEEVYVGYADFDPFQLSALTHETGSPWEEVYRPGRKHIVIHDPLIKKYFSELGS